MKFITKSRGKSGRRKTLKRGKSINKYHVATRRTPPPFSKHKNMRYESDAFGIIAIPKDKHWGPVTQRSLQFFSISSELMPIEFIHNYALFKKCAAKTNYKLKRLDKSKMTVITKACDAILDNTYNNEFPLHIWQTGSGTQTNMNVNEVISNICNKQLTGKIGTGTPINPNDDVNMSQSSNDSFITVIHITIARLVTKQLIPNLSHMISVLKKKTKRIQKCYKNRSNPFRRCSAYDFRSRVFWICSYIRRFFETNTKCIN